MLVSVWYLEQGEPGELRPPRVAIEQTALVRLVRPTAQLARYLYRTVGADWNWRSRSDWDDRRWNTHLAEAGTELWMSWHRCRPSGYVELNGGVEDGRTARIQYLGLLPGMCGSGLGAQLVTDATRRAWSMHHRTPALRPVERVVVNTSDADGPYARHNYVARGFKLVGTGSRDRSVGPGPEKIGAP